MEDMFEVMKRNKEKAIALLKEHGGHLNFTSDESDNTDDNRPYVLITNRYDEILDLVVDEAKLNSHDEIEVLIGEWNEWVKIEWCLSATPNNVYMAIDNILN